MASPRAPPTTRKAPHSLMRCTSELGVIPGEVPPVHDTDTGNFQTSSSTDHGHSPHSSPASVSPLFFDPPAASWTAHRIPSNSALPLSDSSRQRQMVKLVRTLGPEVLPDLVSTTSVPQKGRCEDTNAQCAVEKPRLTKEQQIPLAPPRSALKVQPSSKGDMQRRGPGWEGEWTGAPRIWRTLCGASAPSKSIDHDKGGVFV